MAVLTGRDPLEGEPVVRRGGQQSTVTASGTAVGPAVQLPIFRAPRLPRHQRRPGRFTSGMVAVIRRTSGIWIWNRLAARNRFGGIAQPAASRGLAANRGGSGSK